MNYLQYQYCLSDFVVVDDFKIEYFTNEEDENNVNSHQHKTLLRNIVHVTGARINKLDGLIKRIYIPNEKVKEYLNGDKKFFTFNPLSDAPELYLEMNKIDIFNEKSLIKFVKNYGIPFHVQMSNNGVGVYPTVFFQKNDKEKFLLGMDVLMFYADLFKFQNILRMWNWINEENVQKMNSMKEDFEFQAQYYTGFEKRYKNALTLEEFVDMALIELGFVYRSEIEEIFEDYKDDPNKINKLSGKALELQMQWEKVKNSELRNIATAYLNLKLKELKSGETSTRFINGKIVPAISFNNLLEVSAYQLKQAIFKGEKLVVCLNCGSLFEPRHASQKFCAPLPGRKRSSCENTYNQRLKRNRKKGNRTNQ